MVRKQYIQWYFVKKYKLPHLRRAHFAELRTIFSRQARQRVAWRPASDDGAIGAHRCHVLRERMSYCASCFSFLFLSRYGHARLYFSCLLNVVPLGSLCAPLCTSLPPALKAWSTTFVAQLRVHLPVMLRYSDWVLMFTTDTDGISLKELYRQVKAAGPIIIVVKDTNGYVCCLETPIWWVFFSLARVLVKVRIGF